MLLYREKRRGYRASFTKGGLNIRVPKHFSQVKQKEIIDQLLQWAEETLQTKPELLRKYEIKQYKTGDVIKTFDKDFLLVINHAPRKTIGLKIIGDELRILLPKGVDSSELEGKHISKALASYYKPDFQKRLTYWNQLFPKQHKSMRLKYNSSNWGSCSTSGNINLSTRLFLCPTPVIDYVIVHELAHLIHHNHSKSFWAEVQRVMPDYKQHARWLKTTGAHLDF